MRARTRSPERMASINTTRGPRLARGVAEQNFGGHLLQLQARGERLGVARDRVGARTYVRERRELRARGVVNRDLPEAHVTVGGDRGTGNELTREPQRHRRRGG